ncbi:hypothetical protein MRX96_029624 [Rhipicephalus microplus]
MIWPHHIYRSQHSCRRPAPAWIFSLGIKINDRRHARVKAVVVADANTRLIAVLPSTGEVPVFKWPTESHDAC